MVTCLVSDSVEYVTEDGRRRGTWVWTTCPKSSLRYAAAPGRVDRTRATSWSQVRRPAVAPPIHDDDWGGDSCAGDYGCGWWFAWCSASALNHGSAGVWSTGDSSTHDNVAASRMLVTLNWAPTNRRWQPAERTLPYSSRKCILRILRIRKTRISTTFIQWRIMYRGCISSNTMFTLFSRLYNQLAELCKWAQPSGAWAVQPERLGRH